jgi:hypothetical protein
MMMKYLARVIRPVLLIGLLGLAASRSARADLVLPGCSNVAMLEGFFGVMDCTVNNTGTLDVKVDGQSVVAVPIGPDLSDLVIGIIGIGDMFPTILAGGSHTFEYALFTPPEFDHGDYGISVVSPIYSGQDDNGFVKGSYTGGLAAVLDDPMDIPPPDAFPPPPPFEIPSLEDFHNSDTYFRSLAGDRGIGFTDGTPEPGSTLLIGAGLIVIGRLRRRRRKIC